MVFTFFINKIGGIEFDANGSIKMVGTPNKLDPEEKLQSLMLRFQTQLGENSWAPDEGFDYQGIFSQRQIFEEYQDITQEKIIQVNSTRTLSQDKQISEFIDNLEVTIDEPLKEATVDILVHTVEGKEIEGKIRIGRDVLF